VASDGYAGAWSDSVAFTLIPPPPTPDPEKPEGDGKDMRIRWRVQGENLTYHVQVASDENFRKPLIDRKVDRPEITFPTPENAGIYYVRISALDRDGDEGSFSPPQTFEVKRRLWPYGLGVLGGLAVILLVLL
jgi:hypothetical protein